MKRLKSKFQSIERSRLRRLVGQGSWILVGQIATVAASLVLVRVLTEHLDPTQYGLLALALTLGMLIGQVAFSGAMPGIMRYYAIAAEKACATPATFTPMSILVTGGAGFIGSNFIQDWFANCNEPVINLDALTYAGNPNNLNTLPAHAAHTFVHGNIADRELVGELLTRHTIRAVVHFAAESHVDSSIHGPEEFIQTKTPRKL